MKIDYKIRAVQVDLARQMETIPFLKEYIDFIAEHHYNTLFLYLEWRIRTKTFDIGKTEGYSAEELRELIEYAASRGIDVIPGLATLGHAELLFQQKKFASYSELREGIKGRFGNTKTSDFCPTIPQTRKFLESYLTEVAQIFHETPYLHVGCDEAWDIGYCSECRKKIKTFDDEQQIFADHLLFLHKVVKKLGKRMMIWDDLYETFPAALEQTPRDIIMVNWQYQKNVSGYLAHFKNLELTDRLKQYDKLGFEYLTAPADFFWNNIVTSTSHGDKYQPTGGLLTSWERKDSLLWKSFPAIAAAGQLWSGMAEDGETAMALAVREIFGINDESFINAIAYHANMVQRMAKQDFTTLTNQLFFGPDTATLDAFRMTLAVLMQYPGRMQDTRAEIILNDIIGDLVLKILSRRSDIACWNAIKGQSGESLDSLISEVADAGEKYAEFYVQHRRKKDVKPFMENIENWKQALADVKDMVEKKGMLTIRFVLPDLYGAEFCSVSAEINGKMTLLQRAVFKPFVELTQDSIYECTFPIPANAEITKVKIEANGFGGQGIAYIEAKTAEGTFIPAGITGETGSVEHAAYLLTPDVNYCFIGSRVISELFEDRSKAESLHGITVAMRKTE